MTREELYEMVWASPMTTLAKNLDVSDSYMARVCASLRVPRPDRGYWAKVAAGKRPPRQPLPAAEPGDQLEWSKGQALNSAARPIPLAEGRLTKRLPHPLVRSTQGQFLRSRNIERGDYLKPYKRLLPHIVVSKAVLDRALDFANQLYRAFEARGHRVVIAPPGGHLYSLSIGTNGRPLSPDADYRTSRLWAPDRPTLVYVGSVAIALAIVEVSKKETGEREKNVAEDLPGMPSGRKHYFSSNWDNLWPSGTLQLFASSPYYSVKWCEEWIDTRGQRLVARIPSIVDRIEAAATELIPKLEEAQREAERRQAVYEQERRVRLLREERERIRESRSRSRTELAKAIEQWAAAVAVERFLEEVDQRLASLAPDAQARIRKRLALARTLIDSQDPLSHLSAWKTPEEIYIPGSLLGVEADEQELWEVDGDGETE